MRSVRNLDPGALRQEHPYWNLQSPPCGVDDGNRAISPLWPAEDLKGDSMERVERVEDLDMFVVHAQGIVSADGFTRICIV